MAFANKAFPCAVLPFTAQKPVILSCFRANFTASIHFFSALVAKFFLLTADFALLTILPLLFLVSRSLVRPPPVFSLDPRKTTERAIFPRAILLFFTFIAFIAFIAFVAGAPRLAAFMGSMAPSQRCAGQNK